MKAGIIGLIFAVAAGCATLTPRGELRQESLLDAMFTLEQAGVGLFGANPPTLAELRSPGSRERIITLVRKLEGPRSASADKLLESLAVLEGKSIAWSLYDGFETLSDRMSIDNLNVILMKSTAVKSVTIQFPETGYTIRYRIWLTDTGFGYSEEETGHSIDGQSLSEAEENLVFRNRCRHYWKTKLKSLGVEEELKQRTNEFRVSAPSQRIIPKSE